MANRYDPYARQGPPPPQQYQYNNSYGGPPPGPPGPPAPYQGQNRFEPGPHANGPAPPRFEPAGSRGRGSHPPPSFQTSTRDNGWGSRAERRRSASPDRRGGGGGGYGGPPPPPIPQRAPVGGRRDQYRQTTDDYVRYEYQVGGAGSRDYGADGEFAFSVFGHSRFSLQVFAMLSRSMLSTEPLDLEQQAPCVAITLSRLGAIVPQHGPHASSLARSRRRDMATTQVDLGKRKGERIKAKENS